MGASPSTTEAVAECFAAGAITSTSAMVWMPDSEHAAQLALASGLSVGMHLNFTLPFAGGDVPEEARARQLCLTAIFGAHGGADDNGGAPPAQLVASALADQLEQFRELFGEPTHLDGHHHIHVHPAVLGQLPRNLAIRPPLTTAGRRTFGQRWLMRRFRRPDACIPLERVHPALGGAGLGILEQARTRTLEVMVHPVLQRERDALLGSGWLEALATMPLGSYRDL